MFDRKELKARAKAAFKANYWRCVVVALIMALIVGGGASSGRSSVQQGVVQSEQFDQYDYNGNGKLDMTEIRPMLEGLVRNAGREAALAVVGVLVSVVALVAALGSLLSIFVTNPLSLGCDYFFLRNSDGPAGLDEISRGFTPAWWNNVAALFLRGLFLTLWTLLFVFPVFVKAQSYRLVPYIQAENPDLRGTEAITLSRRMMNGHKWEAFVFDLSFIGWYILAAMTASIAGVLWVSPYKAAADAELYKAIRDEYRG